MSVTISNLEVIISSNSASQNYIQFLADVDNLSGEDILDTKITYINVGFNGGTSQQLIARFDVPDQQTVSILSKRIPISTANTLAQFQFVFPVASGGQVTVLAADAVIYNKFETRLEIGNLQLELNPTRSGYPINLDNWFASVQTSFDNYFLEDYELRQIDILYDDGTTTAYPLPAETYIIPAAPSVSNSTSQYLEVDQRPGVGGSLPIYVRKDKTVSGLRYTLSPAAYWEPYEILVSPVEVQNNYQLMQLELTTSGNSIYLNVTRGVAPYSYLWNDGATSQNRENIAPGLYSVTVTDALGYTAQASVQLGDLHYFSENPVVLKVNVPDHATKDFLRVVCEVWVEQDYLSDAYEKIFEAEQPVDAQGNTLFDMREVLDSYLDPQLPGLTLQRQDQQFCRFYLRYFERFGDPVQSGSFTQVQENILLMGGMSELEYARGNFFGLHFAQKPFYTWQPLEKYVATDQPEYLLFVVNSFDYTSFEVVARLVYIQDDGSETSSEHVIYSRSGVSKYEPYLFPVGVSQLHLLGYSCAAQAPLDRYEIFVRSGAQIVSEIRTYILDYSIHRYRRYFLYQNSLGGWDTLVTTGKAEQELRIETEALERFLPPDHGPLDRPTQVVSRTARPEVKISAGYQTKAMMQSLQDFLLARQIYTIEEKNKRLELTPVEVDLRSATVHDETETLQTFDFSYRPPQYRKYTPVLLSPPASGLPLSASAQVTDDQISLEVSGGTSPYTFAWSDNSTAQNRTALANGSYDVLIRDSQSPPQAYSICGMTIDFSEPPQVLPPANVVPLSSLFIENLAIFDSTAPGYRFRLPTGSSVYGPIMFINNNYQMQPGINRLEMSVLFESGANIIKSSTLDSLLTISEQFQPITDSVIQDVDISVRGSWQRLIVEFDSPVLQFTNVLMGFRVEINNSNDPTFYISDIVLNP